MYKDIENLPSAWKGHRAFANWLMKEKLPETVVELGVDYGYSTFCFAESAIGTVYAIDTFTGDPHCGIRNNSYDIYLDYSKNYNNIITIVNTFEEAAKTWFKPIDILHIDGYHTYEACNSDLAIWSPFVKDDGVILMHDTESFEGVARVYQQSSWNKINFTHSFGLGVLSKSPHIISKIRSEYLK